MEELLIDKRSMSISRTIDGLQTHPDGRCAGRIGLLYCIYSFGKEKCAMPAL